MATSGQPFQIVPQPGFRRILKEDVRFATSGSDGRANLVNGWFDRLMLQSGIQTAPNVWLMSCGLLGIGCACISYLFAESLLTAAALLIVGLLLPILIAMIIRSQRQQKILEQLPVVAEDMARSAQAGGNLLGALQAVAGDTAAPLGDELRLAVRRCDMRIDPGTALSNLPDRTGVAALTMFVSAISVHQDTGGDLIHLLERLATATRDRLHFANRLRAATIASRCGAIMMLVIPPLVILFYVFREPTYLERLTASFPGRFSLGTAIALQLIGAFFVFRILKKSARF
jgi:tight adherence protein B